MTRSCRMRFVALTAGLLFSVLSAPASVVAQRREPADGDRRDSLSFTAEGHTFHGDWQATVTVDSGNWRPGTPIAANVSLRFGDGHLASLAMAGIAADRLCLLVTAERTFDADGWMRLAGDERMSTLLTPGGLAIEGGVQGALTARYGYQFKSQVDQFVSISVAQLPPAAGTRETAVFPVSATLPADLPPGLYRLRFDVGVMVGTRLYNFNGYTFAQRGFSSEAGTSTYFYSPVIPANGTHVSGRPVRARLIQARIPWVLLYNYNSNGYKGVVADEDSRRFATSDRSLIPDDVILPLFDSAGTRLSYSLEPQFPADTIDPYQNIRWDWANGELSVQIAGPDGSRVDLGKVRFVAKGTNGPTTKQTAFTAWKPQAYGQYTVTATGWLADEDGRRYEGGGTYHFWMAKRMTLATATFQGMPYPVGSSYGRDIQFNPAVPADVKVTATLYVSSDARNVRSLSYSGKASTAGVFGAAQGMKPFPLDAPGEYHAKVLATYTDLEGHLWVSTMRHAGVVYSDTSPVVARGKKIAVGGKYVERGETATEGYVEGDGTQHLVHIAFPYASGDVLQIAAEGQGANKIEPVLTYQMQGDTSAWDTKLNGTGTTNLLIKTSNGYSPHLFPEYITNIEYYYGAAPRPGFMGRFIVAESVTRAPYWAVSPNSFGGQIAASPNGDAPGDIYRLLGAVVLRRAGQAPMYAGYMSSAFLLPRGTNNNRVIAAGSEDLFGPLGDKARFFLVGLRPGTSFEVGSTFRPAVQIDPLLPVSIHFVLTGPDGRQQVADGIADKFGSFAGPTAWPLDIPGIYRYQVTGSWNGYNGRMPGLPDSGGEFFVYSKTRPAGSSGLTIDGATQRTFPAATGTTITGTSTATTVHYTLITPGAVIDQGDLTVKNGKFSYTFNPAAVHARVPLYDIVSITTGQPQIGRVIHLTFFAQEAGTGGGYFDVARVILRGTTLLSARAFLPTANVSAPPSIEGLEPSALGAARPDAATLARHVAATSPSAVRAADADIDRMVRDGRLVPVRRDQDSLLADRTHERLQQYHQGVPVFGSDVTRQFRNGQTVSVFGSLHPDIDLDPTPSVTREQAADLAARSTAASVSPDRPPTLVVLPLDGGGHALAWHAEVRTGTDVVACFVDAASGRTRLQYSTLETRQARPLGAVVYNLRGDAARTRRVLSRQEGIGSTDAATPVSVAADRVVADAQANAAAAYHFYLSRFGRAGFDGRDTPVPVVVHPVSQAEWASLQTPYARYFGGAFWDGHLIVLGEGTPPGATLDGRAWRPAARALDLVAHEFTHAVIDTSSGLVYRHDAGALAEAFSDIMASAVEQAVRPQSDDDLIGEDAVSGGLRSLAHPAALGLPDHASLRVEDDADNGGVHANSSIVSHAYYLAVRGGVNETSGVRVEGVGNAHRAEIEKAFYRAFVYMLPQSATFATAREATIQAARDLYGEGSTAERALRQAWLAVGIGGQH